MPEQTIIEIQKQLDDEREKRRAEQDAHLHTKIDNIGVSVKEGFIAVNKRMDHFEERLDKTSTSTTVNNVKLWALFGVIAFVGTLIGTAFSVFLSNQFK